MLKRLFVVRCLFAAVCSWWRRSKIRGDNRREQPDVVTASSVPGTGIRLCQQQPACVLQCHINVNAMYNSYCLPSFHSLLILFQCLNCSFYRNHTSPAVWRKDAFGIKVKLNWKSFCQRTDQFYFLKSCIIGFSWPKTYVSVLSFFWERKCT